MTKADFVGFKLYPRIINLTEMEILFNLQVP
jgi:hypothetical protein